MLDSRSLVMAVVQGGADFFVPLSQGRERLEEGGRRPRRSWVLSG